MEFAAGMIGADPEDVDADDDARGRQQLARNGSTPSGSTWCRGPGRPPHRRSGASDQTPIRRTQHDLLEQSIHRAIRHQHRGHRVAEPVTLRFRPPPGASVGARSGNERTAAAIAPCDSRRYSAATTRLQRRPRTLRCRLRFGARRRAAAPINRTPVDRRRSRPRSALRRSRAGHPHEREQEPVGDESDHCGECFGAQRSSSGDCERPGKTRAASIAKVQVIGAGPRVARRARSVARSSRWTAGRAARRRQA